MRALILNPSMWVAWRIRDGKKMITNAVSVDDKDIAAFKALDAKGIELDVRKVSNDNRQYMMDLLKKNNLL